MTESMTSYNAANDACDSNELFEVAFLLFFHDKKFVLKKSSKRKVSILIKSYSKHICITLRIEIIFPCFNQSDNCFAKNNAWYTCFAKTGTFKCY